MTIGDTINEYKDAFLTKSEGNLLLKRRNIINSFSCSEEIKSKCFMEEIDMIVCAYIELNNEHKITPED